MGDTQGRSKFATVDIVRLEVYRVVESRKQAGYALPLVIILVMQDMRACRSRSSNVSGQFHVSKSTNGIAIDYRRDFGAQAEVPKPNAAGKAPEAAAAAQIDESDDSDQVSCLVRRPPYCH